MGGGNVSVVYKDNAILTQHMPVLDSQTDDSSNDDNNTNDTTDNTTDDTTDDTNDNNGDNNNNDDTDPAPTPTPHDLGPQYYDFIKWVNDYEPHLSFGGCGIGLIEDYDWTDDW